MRRPNMFIFCPAISEQILNILQFEDIFILNWWMKNAPFQHRGALLSAYHLYSRTKYYKDDNFLQVIHYPSDYLFIVDSGGYELYSKDSSPEHEELVKILTPQKILSMQEAIADIGIILDVVPYKKLPDERFHYDPIFFLEAMEKTARNTEIAIANRNPASKVDLYGVLQGKEELHQIRWYNRMKIYEDKLDGWAVSPKADNSYERLSKVMMYLTFILENEINKPIHFLGVGFNDALALIIYLQRKDQNGKPYFPHLITADSTTYNVGARFGDIIGKDPSWCNCPLTILHNLYKFSDKYWGIALSLHNLYFQQYFIHKLTSLIAKDPKEYIEYVLARSGKKDFEMSIYFKTLDSIVEKKRRGSLSYTLYIPWKSRI